MLPGLLPKKSFEYSRDRAEIFMDYVHPEPTENSEVRSPGQHEKAQAFAQVNSLRMS